MPKFDYAKILRDYGSPSGRIDARTYLRRTLTSIAVSAAVLTPGFLVFRYASQRNDLPVMFLSDCGLLAALLLSGWSCLAIQIQRLHDQNRSGVSAVIMGVFGLFLGPAITQSGMSENQAIIIGLVLTLGYATWLYASRGRNHAGGL